MKNMKMFNCGRIAGRCEGSIARDGWLIVTSALLSVFLLTVFIGVFDSLRQAAEYRSTVIIDIYHGDPGTIRNPPPYTAEVRENGTIVQEPDIFEKKEESIEETVLSKKDGDQSAYPPPERPKVHEESTVKKQQKNTKKEPTRTRPHLTNMAKVCDFSNPRYDLCDMEGDVRTQGNLSTSVFLLKPTRRKPSNWKLKPYPRKNEYIMQYVKEVQVKLRKNPHKIPTCDVTHNVPAIVFSAGGLSSNHFHVFNDVLIPLFITSHRYRGEVQFLVVNMYNWVVDKFTDIFKQLTNYELIEFDRDPKIHCFPRVTVGLELHKDLGIIPNRDSSGENLTIIDFKKLLMRSYSLDRMDAIQLFDNDTRQPRLLILSRTKSRSLTNQEDVITMAKELGFEVVVADDEKTWNITEFAQILNSCDVMVGVHGAGLTNELFLPTGAVLVQIIPFGVPKATSDAYSLPTANAKIKYLEYKVSKEESSLIHEYSSTDPVLTDPSSIHKLGWVQMYDVYLKKQDVKVDLSKFREMLVEALRLLHVEH